MDDDDSVGVVNYVLVIRKSPLLLAGAIFFGLIAIRCYQEWGALNPVQEGEEE